MQEAAAGGGGRSAADAARDAAWRSTAITAGSTSGGIAPIMAELT